MALDPRFVIDTPENREYLREMSWELLRFAGRFPSQEGCAHYLRADGTPWREKNLDTYETCRMVHSYCLGKFLGYPGSDGRIQAGLKGLLGVTHDKAHGGWHNSLKPDHSPEPGKLCYSHAFVILAAASAVLAGQPQAEKLLKDALECFEERFWDEETGMTYDSWDSAFAVLDDYRGLNANMHSVEAFLAAADATGEELWRSRAGRIIDRVLGWAEENQWRIPEHFTRDWQPDLHCNADKPDDPFKPYGATPGHGLEWARLIAQWALSAWPGRQERQKPYLMAAEQLFARAVADGWKADGAPGFVYTTDWAGKPVVHDRMHWTLAEGINTAAVLYRITGKQEYAARYQEFLQYLEEWVHDPVYGSWHHQLDRNNQVLDTVWPGKPDIYHGLQAMLIPYCDPAVSVAAALARPESVEVTALGELLIDFAPVSADAAGYPTMAAHPGGAPANFLAALAKFGTRTALLGKVGEDAFGALLKGTLERAGIETRGLLTDPEHFTTLAFVTLDEQGDRQFSFSRKPGADTCLRPEEVEFSLIEEAKVFHFGTLSLTDEPARSATRQAVAYAKSRGKLITYDPNLRIPLWRDLEEARRQLLWGLGQADVVKISDEEVEFLFGLEAEAGGKYILEHFPVKLVFVTCGAGGCFFRNKKAAGHVPSLTGIAVRDTTGAGDIFGGSALWKLLQLGRDPAELTREQLREIATFACASAGLSTTRSGGISSVPELREVLDALKGQKG